MNLLRGNGRIHKGDDGRVRRGWPLYSAVVIALGTVALCVMTSRLWPISGGIWRELSHYQMQKITDARTQIATFGTALRLFHADTGRLPATEEGLAALAQSNATGANCPYLEGGIPKDPWGRAYIYVCPGKRNPEGYDLYCDGHPDANNWTTP